MTDKSTNDPPSEVRSPHHDEGWAKLDFNPDEYREELRECGYTKEQEDQLLQALWDIMSTMVYMDWGLDSIHLILPQIFSKASTDSDKLVNQKTANVSKHKPQKKESRTND